MRFNLGQGKENEVKFSIFIYFRKTRWEMKLAKNLQYLINKNGMTIASLARKTGVSPQTLHNWICGVEPRSVKQSKL